MMVGLAGGAATACPRGRGGKQHNIIVVTVVIPIVVVVVESKEFRHWITVEEGCGKGSTHHVERRLGIR